MICCRYVLGQVTDPALLFLDEPTSGLDSTSCRSLVATLQHVRLDLT